MNKYTVHQYTYNFIFMKLLILFLVLFSTNIKVLSQDEEMPPLNCPDASCKNPESRYEWIFFPQNFSEPCPNCDFSVYVRYDICIGPPRTIYLEISRNY